MLTPQIVFTLDIETTGLSITEAEPVQLGCTTFMYLDKERASQSKVVMNSYCNPTVAIEDGAQEIHGISKEMVKTSPEPAILAETLELLIQQAYPLGDVVTCSYNGARFDMPILSRFCSRLDEHPHVDVFALVMRKMPELFGKLGHVYKEYVGKEPVNAHDATADCLMTSAILRKYCCDNDIDPISISEELAQPEAYKIFPFGKHAGKPIESVPKRYARWCLDNFESVSPDLNETFKAIMAR